MKAMLSRFLSRIGSIPHTIFKAVQVIGIKINGLEKGLELSFERTECFPQDSLPPASWHSLKSLGEANTSAFHTEPSDFPAISWKYWLGGDAL